MKKLKVYKDPNRVSFTSLGWEILFLLSPSYALKLHNKKLLKQLKKTSEYLQNKAIKES
jgi:hypothetical protein